MKRYLTLLRGLAGVALPLLLIAAPGAAAPESRIVRVKMKIDGYLCGN